MGRPNTSDALVGMKAGLPEELSHRDAALVQHGGNELCQIEPDMRDVDGDVLCSLQSLF